MPVNSLLRSFAVKTVLYCTILTSSLAANAQMPAYFKDTYGGSLFDTAFDIKQTPDTGYIIAGTSNSLDYEVTGNHGYFDAWIIKIDRGGNGIWEKSYGAENGEAFQSIQPTTDGGYIAAGYSSSASFHGRGGADFYVVKLDDTGRVEWSNLYGGTANDRAVSVQQTTDGGYIVAGVTESNDGDVTGNHLSGGHTSIDCWILKLSSTGAIDWQKTLGGSNEDRATGIKQTTDGGYIVSGFTASHDGDVTGLHGTSDFWIVKLTSSGAIDWQKTLGGSQNDQANSIIQTTDGGYMTVGFTASTDGDVTGFHNTPSTTDFWVVKLNSSGAIDWEKTYGSLASDVAYSVAQDYDGGYIISGYGSATNGDMTRAYGYSDMWTIKVDDTGALQWQATYGGIGVDLAYAVLPTPDTSCIMAGITYSSNVDINYLYGICDFFVVKMNKEPLGVPAVAHNNDSIQVYPTYTTGAIHVTMPSGYENASLNVMNMQGQTTKAVTCCGLNRTIYLSGIPPGIYLLQVVNNGHTKTYKIEYQP